MANQELVKYIKETLNEGFTEEKVRSALVDAGWGNNDIEEAFSFIDSGQTLEQISSEPAGDFQPINKKSNFVARRKTSIFIVAVLVCVFTAFSAYAGYYYYKTVPIRTIKKMQENLAEVKSAKFDIAGEISINAPKDPEFLRGKYTFNSTGAFDKTEEKNPKYYNSTNLKLNIEGADSKEFVFEGSLDAKLLEKLLYFKLNFSIDSDGSLDFIPDFNELLEEAGIKDKWIKIDLKELEELSSFVPLPSEEDESFDEIISEQEQKNKEIEEKLKELAEKYDIFGLKEYLGSETVSGVKTKHIKFNINKEELKKFMVEAADEISKIMEQDFTDKEEYTESVEKSLKMIKNFSGEIWVGKEDYFLYKALVNLNVDDKEEEVSMDINIEASFSDYNEPVEIEKPKNTITIEEVVEKIMGVMMKDFSDHEPIDEGDIKKIEDIGREGENSKLNILTIDDWDWEIEDGCHGLTSVNECDNINWPINYGGRLAEKYECYRCLAILKKDDSICDNIESQLYRDSCYWNLVVELNTFEDSNKIDFCDKIKDENQKKWCNDMRIY